MTRPQSIPARTPPGHGVADSARKGARLDRGGREDGAAVILDALGLAGLVALIACGFVAAAAFGGGPL